MDQHSKEVSPSLVDQQRSLGFLYRKKERKIMSIFFGSSRRRKILFATVAIATSGYVSYRLYNSSSFVKKRKQLLQIMSTMSFFSGAIAEGAESMSMISKDLKDFLSCEEDTVPRSLRQAFKLWQCQEFQETVTVLSAALTRGFLRGARSKSRRDGHLQSRWRNDNDPGGEFVKVEKDSIFPTNEDVACREIREVCFTVINNQEGSNRSLENYSTEHELEGPEWSSNIADDVPEYKEKSLRRVYTLGSGFQDQRLRKNGIKEKKGLEEFPDRFLSKLFGENGIGFVSAVAGSMARNFVLAFFDGFSKDMSPSKELSSNGHHESTDKKASGSAFIDVISNENCKALIAECIQTFVSTAVTIYIDKTKDVNIYEDMVAGITNPSHKDEMKDVLTSVCNGAIETLVRTSYSAIVTEKNGKCEPPERGKWKVEEYSLPSSSEQQYLISSMETKRMDEVITEHESSEGLSSCMESSKELVVDTRNSGSSHGMQSFVDGVTRTLAIPSNQKLILDMVGKVSSEAVRSIFEVTTNTFSFHLRSQAQLGWSKVKSHFSGDGDLPLQIRRRSNDLSAKAFIMASICLAICLHILTALLHLSA